MSRTKRKLIEAYIQEVYQKGIQEVNLLSISKFSKIPFATVHYHLGKANILLEALELSDESGRNFVDNYLLKAKTGSSIDNYFKANFEWLNKECANASLWLYFFFESARIKNLAKLNQSYSQKTVERILQALENDIENSNSKKLTEVAETLYQLLFGSMVFTLSHDKDSKKVLKSCIDIKNSIISAHFDKIKR